MPDDPRNHSHNDDINPDGLIRAMKTEPRDTNYWEATANRRRWPKGLKWGILGLVVLFIGGFAYSFFATRTRVLEALSVRAGALAQGIADLQNLDPLAAKQRFEEAGAAGDPDASSLMNALSTVFGGGADAVKAVGDLSNGLANLSGNFSDMGDALSSFISTGQGTHFVQVLTGMQQSLATIDEATNVIAAAAPRFGNASFLSGDVYLPFKTQIAAAREFLDRFLPWFADPSPHHILVLLENSSELRPGGGFLGSYADITLQGGNIASVDVRDIADVDLSFKKNIVPPKPLQLEGSRFRPADGNWFFDFTTSAAETTALFEASNLYAQSSTTFDAVIAVTPKVLQDLLAITGPIRLPGQPVAFSSDNFLVQVQKIVQAGQAQSATYPKKVLKDFSAALISALASSTPEQTEALQNAALDWAGKKDVMLYFKNASFERFIDAYDLTGSVYQSPTHSNNDYLALANANINGDKSDLYVSQDVSFETELGSDGTATDHLSITRRHSGNQSPYWWYQTTNQDFLQVFVPDGSSLENASGTASRTIVPPINFARSGYSTDPLVASIESSTQAFFSYPTVSYHTEAGKRVFSTWIKTFAGKTSQVSFDYSHRLFAPPADGQKYEFVFEKQPGAQGDYKFTVNAPLGYSFIENNLPSYEYESNDPPGRLVIDLTLQKI